jgi:membrane protease YdiL (CAAX protease family)
MHSHHKQTLIFLLLAYGVTWLIWIPFLLGLHIHPLQHYIAPYGPLIAGILTVRITRKARETKDYLKNIFRFPKKILWYLFALGTPWAAFLIAAVVKKALFGEFSRIEQLVVTEPDLPQTLSVSWLLWIFSYGLGEEAGWRGFLFQHFLEKKPAFISSILTSIFWAAWHLPAFFFDKNLQQMVGPAIMGWLIGLVSGSVLLSWMTLNAGKSVIPAVLWHGTFNTVTAGTDADAFISAFCSMTVIAMAIYLRFKFGSDLLIKKQMEVTQ